MIELLPHQSKVLTMLDSGSILKGGTGSGKSITSIAYYYVKECGGTVKTNGGGEFTLMKKPKPLYIITTARKRDTLDWDGELVHFLLSTNPKASQLHTKVVVDSWNNIKKYIDVKDAFFIFDEQRVVGSGAWVKSFYKIAAHNRWILLTATPGDNWSDYAPVFIANGFFKNITEFRRKHAVYNSYSKYPKIDRYIDTHILMKYRRQITVNMDYVKKTTAHRETIITNVDVDLYSKVYKDKWNPYDNKPIKDISEWYRLQRRVVNSDPSRLDEIKKLSVTHNRIIIFYNFNYELDLLRSLADDLQIPMAEWNGHKHEPVPDTKHWIYLVQYTAGAEGWNCITTDMTVFYSLNYSYKIMKQSEGRIDRLNTPYSDLHYYYLRSTAWIDSQISKAISKKQNFQEKDTGNRFAKKTDAIIEGIE